MIRTDPMKDTPLTDGQTVYLYVSTGPDIETADMPNLVGMEVGRAKELLEQLGFKNVRFEPMESQKPKDEVIYQSVAKGTEEVDVTKEIIVHYSEGPVETTVPETDPPETTEEATEPEGNSFWVSFTLPEMEEDFTLDICLHESQDVIHSKRILAGTTSTTVEMAGRGTMLYDLYINGEFLSTQKVKFSDD